MLSSGCWITWSDALLSSVWSLCGFSKHWSSWNISRTTFSRVLKRLSQSALARKFLNPIILANRVASERIIWSVIIPFSREWSIHLQSAASSCRVFVDVKSIFGTNRATVLLSEDRLTLSRPIRNIARTIPSRVLKRVNHSVFALKLRKPTVLANRAAFERIVDSSTRMPLSREWSIHCHSAVSIRCVFLAVMLLLVFAALLSLTLQDLGASPFFRSTWNIFRITVSRVLKRANHPVLALKLQRPISVAIRVAFLRIVVSSTVIPFSREVSIHLQRAASTRGVLRDGKTVLEG